MATLNQNILSIKELLGADIINSQKYSSHPIRHCIDLVLQYHVNNAFNLRDYENCRLFLLVKNLNEIKEKDEKLFKKFIKDIKRTNKETYYGLRIEISVAASLIRLKINFNKCESPDFKLAQPYSNVSIECGSVHLTRKNSTNEDLNKKIENVLRKKSKKTYCNKATTIFIDVTNIHHLDAVNQTRIQINKEFLKDMLVSYGFGSILIWAYVVNPNENRYQWKYTRQDSIHIQTSLLQFLNKAYPLGHDFTTGARFLVSV